MILTRCSRFFVASLFGALLSLFAGAAPALASDLPACPPSGYYDDCSGTWVFESGNTYVGEWKDNEMHGKGAFYWTDGDTYIGEWRNNERHGTGIYTYANGTRHVGQYEHDSTTGQGIRKFADTGAELIGTFKDGSLHGYGVRLDADGKIEREGVWEEGEFKYALQSDPLVSSLPACPSSGYFHNCFGIWVYDSGNRYIGEWTDDEKNGTGIFYWTDGDRYVGDWVKDDKIGTGVYIWPSGDRYFGSWADDSRGGLGIYIHADGDTFLGEYRGSERNGKGAIIRADGSVSKEGVWQDGTFQYAQQALAGKAGQAPLASNQPSASAVTTTNASNAMVAPTAVSGSSRLALVIGNADYASAPLKNPANDANLIARTLRDLDFEVMEYSNLDQRAMKRAIRDFGARLDMAGEDAVGLFFFSGHGMQQEGVNYLLPIGAEIFTEADVDIEAVSASAILAQMEQAQNGVNIVILDACRSNPFSRGFRAASNGLAMMDAPTGSIVAYATSPGTVAYDGTGENSPYTRALAQAMRQPNQKIEEVFKMVRLAVVTETNEQQVPWESSSLIGDFIFLREGE